MLLLGLDTHSFISFWNMVVDDRICYIYRDNCVDFGLLKELLKELLRLEFILPRRLELIDTFAFWPD